MDINSNEELRYRFYKRRKQTQNENADATSQIENRCQSPMEEVNGVQLINKNRNNRNKRNKNRNRNKNKKEIELLSLTIGDVLKLLNNYWCDVFYGIIVISFIFPQFLHMIYLYLSLAIVFSSKFKSTINNNSDKLTSNFSFCSCHRPVFSRYICSTTPSFFTSKNQIQKVKINDRKTKKTNLNISPLNIPLTQQRLTPSSVSKYDKTNNNTIENKNKNKNKNASKQNKSKPVKIDNRNSSLDTPLTFESLDRELDIMKSERDAYFSHHFTKSKSIENIENKEKKEERKIIKDEEIYKKEEKEKEELWFNFECEEYNEFDLGKATDDQNIYY